MINKDNFKALLKHLKFKKESDNFSKNFTNSCYISVDFKKEEIQYPEGLVINEKQTCNFSLTENAVVFECVCKLLAKGYKPKHIELEPKWKLGHGASGGRADILVKDQENKPLLIIECKTYGKEFDKAWKDTLDDGGQLFSYAQQIAETKFLSLYASEFDLKSNQLLVEQRIISHKDNKKILELGEELKSYEKASNVKKRFDVWRETYQLEYTKTGIFEENIQPYKIGKNSYMLDMDTNPVTEKDKEGKYHRFRTILRQHNIARRETAFEVLVNLFLAKIVDEEENRDNLEFYWKGIAYDNYYDFIDRLQRLYQIGMQKFLKDEVMYISSKEIDDAFWTLKNKKNATKKQIQKYFRDLKFFSNNAFSLINVHNERLFNRNTRVLVELVQMWQNLRLKTKEQNQFLGDMFEYFLDNSIKQSEGQYFTPMPITKFIVASLPLEDKIKKSKEPLKAIDYACGAGHFLTEYAHQIKPIVKKYKQTTLSKYYENITGIEKEDRLAKIAKVSAYMYGQDQIKIIEEDALSDINDIKEASYDVLVANPPFAVEGFLQNLTNKQKETYELIKTTKLNSNTNNIQCFFLERAKQLIKGGGVVGVIVPSSILSNSDSTHIATREVILKYFDIIALVELGSGTFGKTGTNTVVLFLRRKDKKPEPAEHYQNRVDDYFETDLTNWLAKKECLNNDISEYQDINIIKAYCQQNELSFNEYIKLFGITAKTISNIDALLKTELFIEYKKAFNNSTEIKNLKKKKFFKDKSEKEKELELNKHFINSLYTIEKEKLFYFMLAYENTQKVLIIKNPSDDKIQKQFLGYEWSGAKGSEGIKYNGGSTVNDIITPLFNPQNLQDKSKINYLIEQNFLGNNPNDLSEFKAYKDLISYVNVADILDFSRKDFNKAFSLTPKKNITIDTKWELVRLENFTQIISGGTPSRQNDDYWIEGIIPWLRSEVCKEKVLYDNFEYEKITELGFSNSNAKWYKKDTTLIALVGATKGKTAFLDFKATTNQNVAGIYSNDNDLLMNRYVYESLKSMYEIIIQDLSQYDMLNLTQIKNIKIPLPPKEIQEKIVFECEVIDHEAEQAQKTIDEAENEIDGNIKEVLEKSKTKSIGELFEINQNSYNPVIEPNEKFIYIDIDSVGKGVGTINFDKEILGKNAPSRARRLAEKGEFIISSVRPNLKGFAFINKDVSNCIFSTGFFVLNSKNKSLIINKVGFYTFMYFVKFLNKVIEKSGKGQYPSINKVDLENLQIPIPPISKQKKLVAKVEKLEQKINQAQEIIDKSPTKKKQILDKYLK